MAPEALAETRDEGAVWPDHVAAVEAFVAVRDRLRMLQITGPEGAPQVMALGLDLKQAEIAWRLSGIEMTPDLWLQVQAIESGAVEAFNEQ